MTIQPKTTYRSENESGHTEIRKSFSVKREQIKVWKEEDDSGTEITHIEVPVSSPSEDRDGDEFSEQGLEHQAAQFRSGEVGMWLDHGLSTETNFPDYRVLEQIGGWKDARIDDDEQLFATAALRPSSDDAQELETMLDEEVAPVGFSVGFIVEKSEEKEDSEHGQIFHKVDLLECSAVGIPSNPDAMVSDSAMATAKAVADAGGYDGEPERLARAITQEMRSSLAPNEQRNQTMQSKQSESELQAALGTVETYLGVDGTSEDDPITEVIDWASETDEADADAVESVAEEALSESDAESLSELPTGEVMEFVTQTLESDGDGEGEDDEGDEEEESGEVGDGKTENDPPELRSQIRDALDEVLLDALTDEEALRSLISDEVRDALAEEEFEVDVTDSFVEELRSELFKDSGSGDGPSGPTPVGTISTYEREEENSEGSESSNESENKGGSGNASKPSPAIGGN
jgi:HK97 family phage prohead protease